MNGILVVDKPEGITSFDVVGRLRKITGERKIGHAGTLDPMATGVLPVFLGVATKTISLLPSQDKRYTAAFRLGLITDTGDITGKVLRTAPVAAGPVEVERAVCSLIGELDQVPPMYSAVRHNGQRLYELARQGIEVEREARRITVFTASIVESKKSDGDYIMEVHCSKGTYIRTLIEEIGSRLGCGATMTALRRTYAAGFGLNEAATLPELEILKEEGRIGERLLAPETPFLPFPQIRVTEKQAARFLNGGPLSFDRLDDAPESGLCGICDSKGVLGLGEADPKKREVAIKCLFRRV